MKGRNLFFTAIVLLLAGAMIWGFQRYFTTPLGTLVVGLDFEGIILDPAKHPSKPSPDSIWEVTPDDIRDLEVALNTYIHQDRKLSASRVPSELRNYKRRYLGILGREGEELIEIFCAHKSVTDRDYWLQNYFEPLDGGDNYWHVTYVVYSKTFIDYFENPSDE